MALNKDLEELKNTLSSIRDLFLKDLDNNTPLPGLFSYSDRLIEQIDDRINWTTELFPETIASIRQKLKRLDELESYVKIEKEIRNEQKS